MTRARQSDRRLRALGREVPAALQEIYNRTIPIADVRSKRWRKRRRCRGCRRRSSTSARCCRTARSTRAISRYELTQGTIQLRQVRQRHHDRRDPAARESDGIIIETITTARARSATDLKKAFGSIPQILERRVHGRRRLARRGESVRRAAGRGDAGAADDALVGLTAKLGGAILRRGRDRRVGGDSGRGHGGGGGRWRRPVAARWRRRPAVARRRRVRRVVFGMTAAQAIPVCGAMAAGVFGVVKGVQALKAQAAHKEVNRLREVVLRPAGRPRIASTRASRR